MTEVTKNAPQTAIIQLGNAFKNFFSGRARYPKFRKKGIHDRFAITNDQFRIKGSFLRIPKLGWVSMHEPLRFKGKTLSAAISRTADSWFVSITIDAEDSPKHRAENQGTWEEGENEAGEASRQDCRHSRMPCTSLRPT